MNADVPAAPSPGAAGPAGFDRGDFYQARAERHFDEVLRHLELFGAIRAEVGIAAGRGEPAAVRALAAIGELLTTFKAAGKLARADTQEWVATVAVDAVTATTRPGVPCPTWCDQAVHPSPVNGTHNAPPVQVSTAASRSDVNLVATWTGGLQVDVAHWDTSGPPALEEREPDDWLVMSVGHAVAVAAAIVDQVARAARVPYVGGGHPAWCDRQGCQQREFHASPWMPATPDGTEMALVEVQVWQHFDQAPALAVQVTEDDEVTHHVLTVDQGATLAAVIGRLLGDLAGEVTR